MSQLDFEQFLKKHVLPKCPLEYVDIAVNSSEVDPSTGDHKPEYVKGFLCKKHHVSVAIPSVAPTNPPNPS